MTTLENLVKSRLANTLGLTLLHSLWEGAAIAAALLAALSLTRSSRLRYVFACAALLLMAAGFIGTLMHFAPREYAAAAAGQPAGVLTMDAASAPVVHARLSTPNVLPWLAPLWIAGVVLFHLYSLAGWIAARRLRHRGVWPAADPWRLRLDQLRARIHLSQPVALLESCMAGVPVVIGFLRPVILMPAGMLAGMAPSQIEAILLHELAHIRRRDYLVNLVGTLVEGFLFYHPAAWWVSHVIRSERENCCDDFVVASTGDRHDYARALAALEQNRSSESQVALAATGSNLVARIQRLLNPRERSPAVLTPLLSAAVLAMGATMALTAWQTQQPAQPPVAAAWTAWVQEDVAYIITDAERHAFRALTTDPEREQFVEQFWLRRDPTPGTPENEFKEEHYRRIAYANAHFSSTLPGWKTDRGRIYITLGPPDEIDAHPSGGTYTHPAAEGGGVSSTFPFQQWRYRYVERLGNNVVMDFVDKQMNGEYPMTQDPHEKDR